MSKRLERLLETLIDETAILIDQNKDRLEETAPYHVDVDEISYPEKSARTGLQTIADMMLELGKKMKSWTRAIPTGISQNTVNELCANQPAGIPTVINKPGLNLVMSDTYVGIRSGSPRRPSKAHTKKMLERAYSRQASRIKRSVIYFPKTPNKSLDGLTSMARLTMDVLKEGWYERRTWFSTLLNRVVSILQDSRTGKCRLKKREQYDDSEFLVQMYLNTYEAAGVYSLEAEEKALKLLKSMVTEEQYRKYFLTGLLIERSKKSGLLYIFRKLRPTLVFRETHFQHYTRKRFLAALCVHARGYYQVSWAGTLVPTDDLICHLLMMRGDEARFWKKSTQHTRYAPQADF